MQNLFQKIDSGYLNQTAKKQEQYVNRKTEDLSAPGPVESEKNDVYDYPSKFVPYNMVFDVKRKLPLFNKSKKSKSLYCAGYYIIKFEKGWVRSYCPKLLTLERYPFKGPFRTILEMKTELANANKRTT